MSDEKSQVEKFQHAARSIECDEDDGRFREQLKKLVKRKPADDNSQQP